MKGLEGRNNARAEGIVAEKTIWDWPVTWYWPCGRRVTCFSDAVGLAPAAAVMGAHDIP